jgi:hypothetical protein
MKWDRAKGKGPREGRGLPSRGKCAGAGGSWLEGLEMCAALKSRSKVYNRCDKSTSDDESSYLGMTIPRDCIYSWSIQ